MCWSHKKNYVGNLIGDVVFNWRIYIAIYIYYIYICFVLLQQSRVASGRLNPHPWYSGPLFTKWWGILSQIPQTFNTLRPRQDGRHFPDDIFKRIIFSDNVWILTKISLKFFLKGPIHNTPALVLIMVWPIVLTHHSALCRPQATCLHARFYTY